MKNIPSRLFGILIVSILLSSVSVFGEEQFSVSFNPIRMHWNPHYAITTTESQIFTAFHEGLVVYHPATLRPVPGAAESWEISEDGLVWTFKLREGLTWSNGDRIVADDFRESWLTLLDPGTASEYASLLDAVKGVKTYRTSGTGRDRVGIEAPDAGTLKVLLENPSPQFLSILCHYSFSPLHRDFRRMEDWTALSSIPVSGPYVIRSRGESEVVMEKNAHYWDADSVSLDSVRIIFSDDSEAVMKDFNRHRIDWVVSGIDNSRLNTPEALVISPYFSTTYYYFSNRRSPWDDKRIRRALSMLLPWDSIHEGRIVPGTSLVPPIPNYSVVEPGFPDPEVRRGRAMELLSEAGYPEGLGLPDLTIRVVQGDVVTASMKKTWENVLSMRVTIHETPFQNYYDILKEGDYDMAVLTWAGDYADPMTFLGMWESGSSFNDARYSDVEFDKLLSEAARLPHLKRLEHLQRAEEVLIRSCQVLPIEHFPAVNLIDLRFVEGWYTNALDIHPFKNMSLRRGFRLPGVVYRFGS